MMTMPLLQQLAQTFRPRASWSSSPMPATRCWTRPGHRRPRHDRPALISAVLLPVIAGSRGCALRRLYALRDDVTDNEAVLDAAQAVLRRTTRTLTATASGRPHR